VRSVEVEIRSGTRPAIVDLTDRIAAFLRPKDEGLLNVFVPHATCGVAIIETGAGSDDDLLGRSTTCSPPTTGGSIGTGRPVTAATTSCLPGSPPR
jgi:thiamine phosphate synthase YjbQ (UPF0047 family)